MSGTASGALSTSMIWEAKAMAAVTLYDAQFATAMADEGEADDYLAPYSYEPSVNPDTEIVRLPIPLSSPELKIFKGRPHYRQSSTAYVDLVKAPYDDGVEAYYKKILGPSWTGWDAEPASIANNIKGWPSMQSAILLNAGESALDWTGVAGSYFLAASKNENPFKPSLAGTYKNFWTSTVLNTTNVLLMRSEMVSRRGFNNKNRRLGVKNLVLFASPELFTTAESVAKDLMIMSSTNPVVKYNIAVEMWPDLAADRWGIIDGDAKRRGLAPFGRIVGTPEITISGVGSAKYELSRFMGYHVLVDLGVGLLRPEAISVAEEP